MTERQFFIVYGAGVLLAELIVLVALGLLGADDETKGSILALFLGVTGLGGGLLLLRYR